MQVGYGIYYQMKNILIASDSFDRPYTKPVVEELTRRGFSVMVFEGDRVSQLSDSFTIKILHNGKAEIRYKDRVLDPTLVAAAWQRRPFFFTSNFDDPARNESFAVQYRGLLRYIWDSIPDKLWLNAPANVIRSEGKLSQLTLAQSVGFAIPETVVSNNWEDILALPSDFLTFKMVNGLLHTKNETKYLTSQKFPNSSDSLPLQNAPYPGIWQSYIEKAREWRITVVGEQTFDAAIYTTKEAKNDWREHQESRNLVQFKAERFPDKEREKCLKFMQQCDLKFGAFDFIEQPDGKIFFLELNPDGEYGWLQKELGFPISAAIASELAAITKH